jgi:hypothetical protein
MSRQVVLGKKIKAIGERSYIVEESLEEAVGPVQICCFIDLTELPSEIQGYSPGIYALVQAATTTTTTKTTTSTTTSKKKGDNVTLEKICKSMTDYIYQTYHVLLLFCLMTGSTIKITATKQ